MLRDEKLYDDLGKVAAPTLIIHGVQDKVIPFAQAKELNRKIRNSYLVPFQYSGHGPFWEEREMFNRILTQFIGWFYTEELPPHNVQKAERNILDNVLWW